MGLWTCPGGPSLGCQLRQSLPAATHELQPPLRSFQAVCVDDVPSSDDKDSSVQTKQMAGISSNEQEWQCSGGPRCSSRAPQSDKSPAWENINARECGRERLSLARDTEMPSDSVGAT